MAWFKVDDSFATSPKVLRIPRALRLQAVGLWTIAGVWCSQHLTDGEVPGYMLEEWGADVSHGTALVDAGLWVQTDAGYRFHDWLDYQSSRADVRALREKERQRKEEWRRKKAEKPGQSPEIVPEVSQGDETSSRRLPSPSNPSPAQPSLVNRGGAATRGSRIPQPFEISEDMVVWARENAPLVDGRRSTERFENHFLAAPGQKGVKRDWVRTWRNWLLKDQEQAESRGVRKPTTLEHGRAVDEILRGSEGSHLRAVTS